MTTLAEAPPTSAAPSRAEASAVGPERYVLVLFFAVVFALAVRPALDHDLWWHLRTAQWMVEHHDWVGVDPFTRTRPGVVRVQTDWLADLSFLGVWRIGGLAGVSLLVATLATVGTALVYRTTTGRFGVRVLVTGVVAAAASVHWVARPQMFTFVLTAAIVLLVSRWRADTLASGVGDRRIWVLVPLVCLGSNLHGGIVYAVLILLAMVVGEWVDVALARVGPRSLDVAPRLPAAARRTLTLATGVAVASMVINPSTLRIYTLPFHQVGASVRYVTEFRHPSLGDVWAWPFFVLLATAVVLLAHSWRRVDAVTLIPLLGTAALALQFVRSVPFFAIAAAPVLAERGSAWLAQRETTAVRTPLTAHDRRRLAQAVGLVVIAVLVSTPFRIGGERVAETRAEMFPEQATAWLNANTPPGELFNEFDWGGYLILHAPEYRVSIDGRTDVYDEYLDTAMAVVAAEPGWEDELDREGVNVVLLHTGVALADALARDADWRVGYTDDQATIFLRR